MIIGNILLYLGVAAALAACYYYLLAARGRTQAITYGRWATYLLAGLSVLACVYLLALILTDQFQVEYVWENSSSTLPLFYKLSALWGGQEGSFLTWLTFGALYALAMSLVFQRAKQDSYEAPTMMVMTAVQLFPLIMLLVHNPFRVSPGAPIDGRGLNPLLQDPYMVIHPPLLFLGFAGMQTSFSFAMAALWKRDYHEWVHKSWPWTLIGWTFLGLGLSLGAFWAYRVLGWGGYWGWDPVENSSLVPWLLAGALAHGMITQKTRGRMVRWNLFLALATYVTIVYSTFLTRSGVLADFSVHSFGASPLLPLMLTSVALFAGVALLLFAGRYRDIPPGADTFKAVTSRDFTSLVVVIAFIFMAAAVAVGTSSPILTGAVAGAGLLCGDGGILLGLGSAGARLCQQSSVATSYYETISAPLLLVFAVAMTFAPILAWQESRLRKLLQMLRWPFVLAVLGTVVASALMMSKPFALALFFFALFALGTNIVMIVLIMRANVWKIGGYLAHVGVALALVGIIGTSAYKQIERLIVFEGGAGQALGYTFEFQGLQQIADDKWAAQLVVRRGAEAFIATPKLQPTEQGMVRTPHIHKYLTEDLYIAPGDYSSGEATGDVLELQKGESKEAAGYAIKFIDYARSGHDTAQGQMITVGAILEVTKDGVTQVVTPTVSVDGDNGLVSIPEPLPGTTIEIYLDTPQVGQATIGIIDTATAQSVAPASISLEIIREPGINMLWAGLLVIAAGTGVAFVRRYREGQRATALAVADAPAVVSSERRRKKQRRQTTVQRDGAEARSVKRQE